MPEHADLIEVDLKLGIHALDDAVPGVRVFDLRRADGGELPAFEAGAHVDVAAGEGRVRQYSLCNDPRERHRYVIAVALDEAGRGGSRWLHRDVRRGEGLRVSAVRNHFRLADGAGRSVLIGGGIGVTPLWAMAQQLEARGHGWELHYCVRTRAEAALLHDIEAFAAQARHGRLHLHPSREGAARRIDLAGLLRQVPADAHLYCCAGRSMLADFKAASASRPPAQVHFEHFESTHEASTAGGFTVVLARSGRNVRVMEGQTILAALEASGIRIRHTCREGICGDCEVAVLEGVPDHRDDVLSDAERAANRSMMICCSGCVGERLVLDL